MRSCTNTAANDVTALGSFILTYNGAAAAAAQRPAEAITSLERMSPIEYKISKRTFRDNYYLISTPHSRHKFHCNYQRTRQIIEELALLFNCSKVYIKSLIFKSACQERGTLDNTFRKIYSPNSDTPLCDFHDQEICSNMFDKFSGYPINALHPDNTLKVINLLFLAKFMSKNHYEALMLMLERLNARAPFRIGIPKLMENIMNLNITDLAYSIVLADRKVRIKRNSSKCYETLGNDYYNLVSPKSAQRQKRRKN